MTDRVAIVTGAAQGIGRGIAHRLDALGHRLVLLDRDAGALTEAAATLSRPATAIDLDVADPDAVSEAIGRVARDHGRIDILINNAGISPAHGGRSVAVEDIALDEWDRVMAVNLTGSFLTCRAVLPVMKAGGWGRIVNFSSMGGRMRSLLSGAHYAATKAGIIGFTRVLAGQVARDGITANCIAPGRIDTPQSRSFGGDETFLAQLPAGRLGAVEDIAGGVEYLVSDAAAYVTGTVLDINGGHYMP
ncbi:3-oxoacyl-[acyl-carrier protein] reductase [Sphingomonas jejuensis]|uniref:3-oxoacyl-[acyl-carrier protein] reductase n=1 Tax=Sphingomonas jejuensis TaxID=904715 RepID=A0ABX0XL62_9SPHN|nr:3-oxoacyl-[acyl-carrier protein] reductase [Sphingomonas jejuensis]